MIICKVLAGDIEPAIRTHAAFFSVWKRYGFTPEGFNLATFNVQVDLLFEYFGVIHILPCTIRKTSFLLLLTLHCTLPNEQEN